MTFTPGKSFENWMSVAGGGGGVLGNLNFAWVVWGISTGSVKSFQYNTRVSLEELQVKSLLIPVDDCVWWAKAKVKTLFYNQIFSAILTNLLPSWLCLETHLRIHCKTWRVMVTTWQMLVLEALVLTLDCHQP